MRRFVLTIEGTKYSVEVSKDAVIINDHPFHIVVANGRVAVDGTEYRVELDHHVAWVNGLPYPFTVSDHTRPESRPSPARTEREVVQRAHSGPVRSPEFAGKRTVKAAMPGRVLRVLVQEGDTIQPGDVLCILEAMKMENELHAHEAGEVQQMLVKPGQNVEGGQVLLVLS